jgi:hypothetical protein
MRRQDKPFGEILLELPWRFRAALGLIAIAGVR